MFRLINENTIKYIQTLTHAHTVERFIYTFKMNLQRRLDALNQDNNDWIKHYHIIVDKYNNMVHFTIEIKPNEAKLHQNHLWVAWH